MKQKCPKKPTTKIIEKKGNHNKLRGAAEDAY
jgi:hypothetical protein